MILGVIALIVVGPKELPTLLRSIGKYAGVLKQHAAEFRAHFDQAMKEAELDQLKNDITGFRNEVEGAARDAMRTAERQADSANRAMNDAKTPTSTSTLPGTPISEPDPFEGPDITDENGLPVETNKPAGAVAESAKPSQSAAMPNPAGETKSASTVDKSGVAEP